MDPDPFWEDRYNMVQFQLKRRGIADLRVLNAMAEVPRHEFVSPEYREAAYQDNPLPIGEGQTISQPFMVGIMTQSLELKGEERVLEIGTGSGYQAAILGRLASQVFTIERFPCLALKAREVLRNLGYTNVEVIIANGTLGYPYKAPFDGIVVAAGAPRVPLKLLEQLVEGGRLVIPLGDRYNQMLTQVLRKEGQFIQRRIVECIFVPLIGLDAWADIQDDGKGREVAPED